MSKRLIGFLAICIIIAVVGLLSGEKKVLGYYGDLVLNNKSEKGDMPPVIFPHWLHRAEFKCKVCHPAIFEMRSGANDINMGKIAEGKFCGRCHNDTIAWAPVQCSRCHSGKPGMKTGLVHGFSK
jgi:c(7)-type cytochrome triheme protein